MEVFDLGKENRFNITGEFKIETFDQKQNYELIAIHPNRTIVWASQYNSVDKMTYHSSKIDLAKDVWIGYNVEIFNHTSSDSESQELKFKISYPNRQLYVDGLYTLKPESFDTNLEGKWLKTKPQEAVESGEVPEEPEVEEKTVAAKFQWLDLMPEVNGRDHQRFQLNLIHPTFDKDITLVGSFYRDGFNVTKVEIDYEYTEDEDHHAKFITEIRNMTDQVGFKNYTIFLYGSHPASDLILNLDGSVGLKPTNYKIDMMGHYKRGYLPDMELEMLSFVDTKAKEIKIYVRICFLVSLFFNKSF